jgi:hypothetical protein
MANWRTSVGMAAYWLIRECTRNGKVVPNNPANPREYRATLNWSCSSKMVDYFRNT